MSLGWGGEVSRRESWLPPSERVLPSLGWTDQRADYVLLLWPSTYGYSYLCVQLEAQKCLVSVTVMGRIKAKSLLLLKEACQSRALGGSAWSIGNSLFDKHQLRKKIGVA